MGAYVSFVRPSSLRGSQWRRPARRASGTRVRAPLTILKVLHAVFPLCELSNIHGSAPKPARLDLSPRADLHALSLDFATTRRRNRLRSVPQVRHNSELPTYAIVASEDLCAASEAPIASSGPPTLPIAIAQLCSHAAAYKRTQR